MQHPFPNDYCRLVQQQIEGNVGLAMTYVHLAPYLRDPLDLEIHHTTLSNLLIDFHRQQLRFPVDLARRLGICLRNGLDQLDMLQNQMRDLTDGAPTPPSRTWELLPRGGRRLVLDIELLAQLADHGMEDKEIMRFLHCGLNTIKRRRKEYGIKKRDYADLTDDDLLEVGSKARSC